MNVYVYVYLDVLVYVHVTVQLNDETCGYNTSWHSALSIVCKVLKSTTQQTAETLAESKF